MLDTVLLTIGLMCGELTYRLWRVAYIHVSSWCGEFVWRVGSAASWTHADDKIQLLVYSTR